LTTLKSKESCTDDEVPHNVILAYSLVKFQQEIFAVMNIIIGHTIFIPCDSLFEAHFENMMSLNMHSENMKSFGRNQNTKLVTITACTKRCCYLEVCCGLLAVVNTALLTQHTFWCCLLLFSSAPIHNY
jgi:hypothetical protein